VLWEGEPGDRRSLTYAELDEEVAALTRALRALGVGAGDVVALHLGWLPETVVAMFACARIGAVHAVIPTPLPPEALVDRLVTLAPRVLFTQDGAWRRGTVLPLKARADEALSGAGGIEHTVVVRRTGIDIAWFEGDRWYHDLVVPARPGQQREEPDSAAAADLPARHPLQLVSLAHRRGRPVTVTLGTAAVLAAALAVHRAGLADGPVLWCAGDVSWLGSQVHGIYGPLLAGQTAVMYEGTLDVPTHARAWQIMRRYAVTTLVTTPSVLRMMRAWSLELESSSAAVDPGAVRRLVAFGEPMDPEIRDWAARGLAGAPLSVADGWGQVELGGIVRLDAPVDPDGMPDLGELIVDAAGHPVPAGQSGELVLTRPWAGLLVGVSGPARVLQEQHWRRGGDVYCTGDLARVGPDGWLEFLGRTDEVVSVSGQLVSLNEVRTILLEHPFVVAADVFERRDQLGARVLAAAVVLDPQAAGLAPGAVARDLGRSVRETLGGLARPRMLMIVDRFGDELRGDERRRAMAGIPVPDSSEPRRVSWAQVLAAAEYAG
jgi:acetyl-CoA synthetase